MDALRGQQMTYGNVVKDCTTSLRSAALRDDRVRGLPRLAVPELPFVHHGEDAHQIELD